MIIAVAILVYVLFFDKPASDSSLTSSTSNSTTTGISGNVNNNQNLASVDSEFLAMLLSIKSLKLNDSIFSNVAFANLRDSSITLIQDNTEGRTNPFAPIGSDTSSMPVSPDIAPEGTSSSGGNATGTQSGSTSTGDQTGGLIKTGKH